jgi:hypothetical protein
MKAKFGMIVVDGRGKLGGHVLSKNRGGAYARTKVTPVNPQTTYQLTARNLLTTLSQGWRSLTQAQRDGWNAAVQSFQRTDIFGDLRTPTGKNLYTRLNTNLSNISEPLIDDAPLPAGGGEVVAGTLVMTNGGAKTIAHSGSTAGHNVQVWATPGVSAGKEFLKNDYRLITIFAGGGASPNDFSAAYEARFGEPAIGTRVGVKLVSVNATTGENGTPSEATTITV